MNPQPNGGRRRLENRVAVVTGGARGIGGAIVRRFVEEGANVLFSDLLDDKGRALERELGTNVAYYRADAASAADTDRLMGFAVERFGGLHCVVNNAGAMGEHRPIGEMSVEVFERSLALLLRGPFLGMKYGASRMRDGGSIINIASVSGLSGGYGSHAYCAAKSGVVGLTKSVALELAEQGIRVNAICPGAIATAIFAPAAGEVSTEIVERTPDVMASWLTGVPLGRSGFPEDVANAALWLASGESSFVTGHAIVVDGGLLSGPNWSQTRAAYKDLGERLRSAVDQTTAKD